MINLNSYDTLGKSGMALMQSSLDTANAAGAKLASSGGGVMDIAEASMDISQAKVQMAMGAFLVKSQNELMESALQIFGIGTKHSGLY